MSFIVNYIFDLLNNQNIENIHLDSKYHVNDIDSYSVIDKKYLISSKDLERVNLKPPENIILNPSRKIPLLDKINLQNLNKAQLNCILNVKLKPIPIINKNKIYDHRHPVLREMLQKVKKY